MLVPMSEQAVDECQWCGQVGPDTRVGVIAAAQSLTGRATILLACGPEHYTRLHTANTTHQT